MLFSVSLLTTKRKESGLSAMMRLNLVRMIGVGRDSGKHGLVL
jgi:hypothetical protein